ncbi:MAG: serine/threonine-protein kinase, partial [Phycisphaerales bacterium]
MPSTPDDPGPTDNPAPPRTEPPSIPTEAVRAALKGAANRSDRASHEGIAPTVSSAPEELPAGPAGTPIAPGAEVGGRYRLLAHLGRGGMGDVWKAEDRTLGVTVALKFLPGSIYQDTRKLERFRAEVRLARRVSHPNVCRVFDIGEASGRTFITMEHVDGEDLASLLRRIGRLPREKAVETARQLCSGLAAAHSQRVIHRDLKPSNIMIDGRGRVRIMDFGVAAAGEAVRGAEAGAGTPLYMAPEQFAGTEASRLSDDYALGLVLYEIFTGRMAH